MKRSHMVCFQPDCNTAVSLRSMSKHFKTFHGLKEQGTYRCTFNGCYQYLASFSSLTRHFKKHLQMELATAEDGDTGSVSSESSLAASSQALHNQSFVSSSQFSVGDSAISDERTLVNLEDPVSESFSAISSPFSLSQNDCPDIVQAGVALSLQLHNNNNFNRKDVITIQQNVKQKLFGPLLARIESFVQNTFHPLTFDQSLLLSSFMQEIDDPFRACATDYQTQEYL